MEQSSNGTIYSLIFIGIAILVHTFFTRDKKAIKEDCQEGFGIIFNGELILDSNRPLYSIHLTRQKITQLVEVLINKTL